MAQGSHPFGGTPPVFTVVDILLYCLQVTVSTGVCSYVSGSGTYTSITSITAFMAALEAGTLPPPDGPLPTFGLGDAPPDILVTMPCYVVIVLSSSDQPSLCFQTTAMTTGSDCSTKYYGLTEASKGTVWHPTVAYFAVPVVAPASQHVSDPYTLFLQYISNGSTVTYNIDPGIKNRGDG